MPIRSFNLPRPPIHEIDMRLCIFPGTSEREAALRCQVDLLLVVIKHLVDERAPKPLRFSDEARRDIATHAQAVGWKAAAVLLVGVCALTTVQGWFKHVVERATRTAKRKTHTGGNRLPPRIRKLVRRMAIDNPSWGYDTIANAINGLDIGRTISDQSVGNILKEYGIPPAGERGARRRRWRHFIAAHWHTLASCDFTSIPVLTLTGFRWVNVLVFMHLATRRVHVACIHQQPDDVVMAQVARNLTMADTGWLTVNGITHLIRDRDGKFSDPFTDILDKAGVTTRLTPVKAPNANAHIERWFRSLKEYCTDLFWIVGEATLRHVVHEYAAFHNTERYHQGLGGQIPDPPEVKVWGDVIHRKVRLGGLLSYYHRKAA